MSTVETASVVPTYSDMAPISHWPVMFFWASTRTGIADDPLLLNLARERLIGMEVLNGRGGMLAKPS